MNRSLLVSLLVDRGVLQSFRRVQPELGKPSSIPLARRLHPVTEDRQDGLYVMGQLVGMVGRRPRLLGIWATGVSMPLTAAARSRLTDVGTDEDVWDEAVGRDRLRALCRPRRS